MEKRNQSMEKYLCFQTFAPIYLQCSCGSVVEHCVSSAKGCGFNSQGTHILIKKKKTYSLNARFG